MWEMPSDLRLLVALEGRIAGEERIDEHGLAGEIEPESGMTEPRDFHGNPRFRHIRWGASGADHVSQEQTSDAF